MLFQEGPPSTTSQINETLNIHEYMDFFFPKRKHTLLNSLGKLHFFKCKSISSEILPREKGKLGLQC